MNFAKTRIAAMLMVAACACANASATTIDFEHGDAGGVPGGVNETHPITTQGFTFGDSMDIIDITTGVNSGYGPAHSGNFALINDYGPTMAMTSASQGLFTLQNFWIMGFDNYEGPGSVMAYLNGALVGSLNFSINATWSNVVANFGQADQIVVDAGGANYFIDDVSATASASDVPEPASVALFGLGLAGLAALRRKRG
jgi:hypothetical protein